MSLSFGIVYIVRFDNVRSMYPASRWAEVRPTLPTLPSTPTHLHEQEAQKTVYLVTPRGRETFEVVILEGAEDARRYMLSGC